MMFDFQNSVFTNNIIPDSAKIIFVSDLFAKDYIGGAELTTQGLIDSSPFEVYQLHSKDVSLELLRQGNDKFWIFGNFAQLNPQLIPSIVGNIRYSIIEYDFKWCKFRSPEKHFDQETTPCDCDQQMNGKIISAFFYGSMGLWWMSEEQMSRTHTRFPFLKEKDNIVLSSIFTATTLGKMKLLREKMQDYDKKSWAILDSPSWIKGADNAKKWCDENNKETNLIWNLQYDETLAKLATSKGFVYLPKGGDTCPRMVIEAKLLGCDLELNENVLHKDEEWFNTSDIELLESYLLAAPALFWNGIKGMMDYKPTISGYTQTRNCIEQDYPWEQSIQSLLMFCNEVVIVDGGSTDGTWERLQELAISDTRIKPFQFIRDWNDPRFALFNGQQKAEARRRCLSEFCWQVDIDEIVHENDVDKIYNLARGFPKNVDLIALPVVEYWGGPEKVRVDVQPWKWRLSRNKSNITHGLPRSHRKYDKEGNLYSAGSDGDDYIYADSFQPVPYINFLSKEVALIRQKALQGDQNALKQYEQWFNSIVENLPGVYHYSWFNLKRKIISYKNFWSRHWSSLYSDDPLLIHDENLMFDIPWSEVTDEMIESLAKKMKEKLGGWIWHRKWDGNSTTPHIKCSRNQPKSML